MEFSIKTVLQKIKGRITDKVTMAVVAQCVAPFNVPAFKEM